MRTHLAAHFTLRVGYVVCGCIVVLGKPSFVPWKRHVGGKTGSHAKR